VITFGGSARRTYLFPAALARAFDYHRDIDRLIGFLPHIRVAHRYADDRFRLIYSAIDAGICRVTIVCDARVAIDAARHTIAIEPLHQDDPVAIDAGLNRMTGPGEYTSEILFSPSGERTMVDCRMSMRARLPVALSLRLIPAARLDAGADRIFRRRLEEILSRFVEQSIRGYRP